MDPKLAAAGMLATLALLIAGCDDSGQPSATPPSSDAAVPSNAPENSATAAPSQQDQAFLVMNAQTDVTEIMVGKLATEKGTRPTVRQLGQLLMTDHQAALSQLKGIAQADGVTLPSAQNAAQRQETQALANAPISNFDTLYLQKETQTHTKSIDNTHQEIGIGTDPRVKAFAQSYLQTDQNELNQLQTGHQQG
jgi:putative membrane protein